MRLLGQTENRRDSMMNQIRADFYRQRRTLGMYVIVLITIAYAVWSVTSKNVGGVTVHGDDISLPVAAQI